MKAVIFDEQGRFRPMIVGFSWACLVISALLLVFNVLGLYFPLRAAEIDGYVDFAGAPTATSETTLSRLSALPDGSSAFELASQATQILHEGIAHVAPRDIEARGFAYYGMRVPVTENWVLYALSFLKPDTYSDYEFCSYRKAIERGTGRCGQQSLALVSFLEERGFDTGFISLGGHAIATARTDEAGWILLDPDYGGVIPFDLARAEANPKSVLQHYWSPAAEQNRLDRLFLPKDNSIKLGGVRARYARACPIERVAYVLKWLLPALLGIPILTMGLFVWLKKADRVGAAG